MSGKRGGPKRAPTNRSGTAARGRNRPASTATSDVPDVFQEMLRESGVPTGGPRKKRRKVETEDDDMIDTAWPSAAGASGSSRTPAVQQNNGREEHVQPSKQIEEAMPDENSDDTTDDEDDEIDWEDVDLTATIDSKSADTGVLEVTLNDASDKKRPGFVRKKITAIDRKIRLEAHKLHLLCLLAHISRRNKWCNNKEVQENLQRQNIIDDTLLSNLNPAPQLYQLERNTRFFKGLTEVKNRWRRKFWITRRGLTRPHWVDLAVLNQDASQDDCDPPISKTDFKVASEDLTGSRDLAAQLFCALLRSAGVTARLVCSLQVLPFTFTQKGSVPALSRFISRKEDRVSPIPSSPIKSPTAHSPAKYSTPGHLLQQYDPRISSAQKEVLASLRPHSQAPASPQPRVPQAPVRGKTVIKNESGFPVYWVEAWNVASQKWVPVDPMVTNSVGSTSKFEPPQHDPDNIMSYVVAFEEEGHVKDVTRRYAKNFNAKTRKLRLNATKGGELWWLKVLQLYERGWDLDRDQVEDSELASKELAEGIPSSIADLKDHPLFALKRHLRRNQVIHPERPVGSITIGTGSKAITETVYRRQDVKLVRSPMQWYRLGREIKTGEQPLKHITVPKRKRRGDVEDDFDEDEDGETGYYAMFQTEEYIPPAVVDGLVPKNSFGNIDIYVPSMVPRGGIHVPHKDAVKAARIIGIDCAEAVTGFEHKGRQASAVIKGIVIAEEYKAALYTVLGALISEKEEEDAERKSIECLRLWKRFLLGVRIRERIENEYGDVNEGEGAEGWEREKKKLLEANKDKGKGKEVQVERNISQSGEEYWRVEEQEGGFIRSNEFVVGGEPVSLASLAKQEHLSKRDGMSHNDHDDDGGGGGFCLENVDEDDTGGGGGFCQEDVDDEGDTGGGGFIPEDGSETGERLEDEESMLSEDPDIDNEDLDWF